MRTMLRTLASMTAIALCMGAMAQNVVTITGTVSPCMGVSYPVHIQTNTVPPVDTTVNTGANCEYSFPFYPVDTEGSFSISTSCDSGVTWSSATGTWIPFFPIVTMNLSCTAGPCLLEAGINAQNNQPWEVWFGSWAGNGTLPYAYTWQFSDGSTSNQSSFTWTLPSTGAYSACLLVTDANGCEADTCFYFDMDADGNMIVPASGDPCNPLVGIWQVTDGVGGSPIPWMLEAVNFSTGGVEPISYFYQWNEGSTSQQITISSAGEYLVCIYMLDGNGCQATFCDSVQVDSLGNVIGSDPLPCEASFWAVQAMEPDTANPNGTGVPIPYEIWVWNLSSGTGNISYAWDFGDGSTSTDPYPAHTYADEGPYWLCLTISDGMGCTDQYCDSISIDGSGILSGMIVDGELDGNGARQNGFTINVQNPLTTGVSAAPVLSNLALWPNPAADAVNLALISQADGQVVLSLIDINGREVMRESRALAAGRSQHTLDTSALPDGIYSVRATDCEGNSISLRFVKQ